MVDISSYAPPLSAVGAARASTTQATKVATSYGERPTYRDDAVAAGTAIQAMSSKISRLNDMRSLERIDGLLDVTLATTDAIVDTLTEMKTLAARLQDQSLSDDMRATLTNEYNALLPRINELSEMASFGGRDPLNPDAAQISGDLELPDGQVIEARDLRSGRSVVEALDPPIKAPGINKLMAAFAFDWGHAFEHRAWRRQQLRVHHSGAGRSRHEKNGIYHDLKFTPKAASGVAGSFKAHAEGSLFQYDYGGQRIVFSLNLNDELEVLRNGSTIAATPIDATEWNQVATPGETAVNIYVGPNSGVQFRGPGQSLTIGAEVQHAIESGVLAAASLSEDRPAEEVVTAYVAAGIGDHDGACEF
eukprot:Skav229928  [mRNA]  locus=scaffold7556:16110:18127:+ [translate_table: standard]